jgi:hypothetical protein
MIIDVARRVAGRIPCRARGRRALPAAAILLSAGWPLLAQSADAVKMELAPASIQLGAGDTDQVMLTVRNDGGTAIKSLHLCWSNDLGLAVSPANMDEVSIEPHGVLAWPLLISQKQPGRTVGKLQFWLTYNSAGCAADAKPQGFSGIAVAALDVQERPPMDIGKLVTLQLEAAVDQLNEENGADLYVVVTNTASVPVRVTRIDTFQSPSIVIQPLSPPAADGTIGPQTSKTFPLKAKATNSVVPGSERVVIVVDLEWTDAGATRQGTLSTGQTLPVGVYGESDLLKAVGVPSFLLLPGVLLLATFYALWTRIAPKKSLGSPLSLVETALISVSLSLLAVPAYQLKTGRNLMRGYGVQDVINVWFGSIFVAFLVWVFIAGGMALWARHKKKRDDDLAMERTPAKEDSPVQMLKRMQLHSSVMPPVQVTATLANVQARAFQLLAPSDDNAKYWVGPPILMTSENQIDGKWSRDGVIAELKKNEVRSSAERLSKLLSDAQEAGWKVRWGQSGMIVAATPVDAVAATDQLQVEFVQLP